MQSRLPLEISISNLVFLVLLSISLLRSINVSLTRIKVFVKVIIERIGLEGIIESLIGYCMRDLQSYVYRCSTKFLCEDFLFLCFFGYVF